MDQAAAGASKALRNATKKIGTKFKIPVKNSNRPSKDFDEILDEADEKAKDYALKWYERGVKRGLIKATDLMVEGKIYKDGDTVFCDADQIDVNVKIKMNRDEFKHSVSFRINDIGFEDVR